MRIIHARHRRGVYTNTLHSMLDKHIEPIILPSNYNTKTESLIKSITDTYTDGEKIMLSLSDSVYNKPYRYMTQVFLVYWSQTSLMYSKPPVAYVELGENSDYVSVLVGCDLRYRNNKYAYQGIKRAIDWYKLNYNKFSPSGGVIKPLVCWVDGDSIAAKRTVLKCGFILSRENKDSASSEWLKYIYMV